MDQTSKKVMVASFTRPVLSDGTSTATPNHKREKNGENRLDATPPPS